VGPACPKSASFVPDGSPGADGTGSVDEIDGGVGMRLEVQPPRRLRFAPAVHGHRHKVGTVLEVAEDGNALGARPSTNRPQSQHPPLVASRPPQAGAASADPVQRSVDTPGGPDEPTWRDAYGSRGIRRHGAILAWRRGRCLTAEARISKRKQAIIEPHSAGAVSNAGQPRISASSPARRDASARSDAFQTAGVKLGVRRWKVERVAMAVLSVGKFTPSMTDGLA